MKSQRVILAVTGSIAAYKAVILLRLFQKGGYQTDVILTDGATKFVTPLTFSGLGQTSVYQDLWGEGWSSHVALAEQADVILVAPCTANTLAKLANGLCDNMLTAILLSARCPVLIAPTMDKEMWTHPATQCNVSTLKSFGYTIIEPETGWLASGLTGTGRMPEPEILYQKAITLIQKSAQNQWLLGKKVLITAGPTREPIDPVRYISNYSTGKMGFALAQAVIERGAEVSLVYGPVNLPLPRGLVEAVPVTTALEMFEAVKQRFENQDLIIGTAAVADYRPETAHPQKLKKNDNPDLTLNLTENPDIIGWCGHNKWIDKQVVVGFALETQDGQFHAQKKLIEKQLNAIVLNYANETGAGFGSDTNRVEVSFVGHRKKMRLGPAPKAIIASELIELFRPFWVHSMPDERFTFRLLNEVSDIPIIYKHFRYDKNPFVPASFKTLTACRDWAGVDKFPTKEDQDYAKEQHYQNPRNLPKYTLAGYPSYIDWMVYLGNEFVGMLHLYNINITETARIGYILTKAFRNKGIGTYCVGKLIEYVKMNYPCLKFLYAHTHPENVASIKLLEKFGFKQTWSDESEIEFRLDLRTTKAEE